MIRYLSGTVHSKEEKSLVLLVNGVGYQVFVPSALLQKELEELELHIYTQVREDVLQLFGFESPQELKFFELLLEVNGVGPKMAITLMSQPIDKLQNAIFTGNLPVLMATPGVGKKVAERLVLELKGKVEPSMDGASSTQKIDLPSEMNEEAVQALESLGYKRQHIQRVFNSMDPEIKETEALIRGFLSRV